MDGSSLYILNLLYIPFVDGIQVKRSTFKGFHNKILIYMIDSGSSYLKGFHNFYFILYDRFWKDSRYKRLDLSNEPNFSVSISLDSNFNSQSYIKRKKGKSFLEGNICPNRICMNETLSLRSYLIAS
jgi:hypothetical protein